MVISNGSFEYDLRGNFKHNESKYILGNNIEKGSIHLPKKTSSCSSVSIQIDKYNLSQFIEVTKCLDFVSEVMP